MALGSSNPVLSKKVFENLLTIDSSEKMTIKGAINKTILLFLLVIVSATISWKMAIVGSSLTYPLMIGGAIGGFVVCLITVFKKEWAMYTAPLYALLEGLLLGAVSAFFESRFPGIALQAIGLTFSILAVLLVVYRAGILRATSKFKKGIFAATAGVLVFYLINMVLGMFGAGVSLAGMGWLGILIQLVIVVIASLNLILDFDFIERGANEGAPKFIEWYAAFGLMVTLIWLYLEILRLVALLSGKD